MTIIYCFFFFVIFIYLFMYFIAKTLKRYLRMNTRWTSMNKHLFMQIFPHIKGFLYLLMNITSKIRNNKKRKMFKVTFFYHWINFFLLSLLLFLKKRKTHFVQSVSLNNKYTKIYELSFYSLNIQQYKKTKTNDSLENKHYLCLILRYCLTQTRLKSHSR